MSSPSLCPKELSGGQGVGYVELSEGQKAEEVPSGAPRKQV